MINQLLVITTAPLKVRPPRLLAAGLRTAAPPGRPYLRRRDGQELARRELSRLIYQHPVPITTRILNAIGRFIDRVRAPVPGGWPGIAILVTILVIVVAVILTRIGAVRRSGKRMSGTLLDGKPLTARDYRANAERLAGAGQFTAAIIDRMRAIAAELEERGVLRQLPGRTADELATEAAGALPALAAALRAAALLFDDVRYGDRAGTATGYQQLRGLDDEVRAARPRSDGATVPASVVVS